MLLDQTIGATEDHLHLRDLIPYEGTSPTQHVMERDIESVVDNLLLELDEPEREVIIQRKMEGLTFGEIASDLGKTEDAVRKQFNRSFQKLISARGEPEGAAGAQVLMNGSALSGTRGHCQWLCRATPRSGRWSDP